MFQPTHKFGNNSVSFIIFIQMYYFIYIILYILHILPLTNVVCSFDPDQSQQDVMPDQDLKCFFRNSLLASGNFCCLLITFANSLDPDQD